ncbi:MULTISPECIES: RagB/SusD family nutrient uptake outer membrane protein [Spirosoma]|uniref:RagB/SusD family nutrient uptake outer membrane protein n=1 Tax=Spirosoma sordidisoli TaxID=2502893 RepID=A0A4Q2UT81_9BACT|nr:MULTISPECIES: RagB/SusD family nutrient uptake outer membrane protein [Spirosoma]RYC70960.1 RagB/SusD family nutrient uptake outer membrane protein [Spirosoma sordidisoli]
MKKYIYSIICLIGTGLAACQDLDREFVTTIGRNEIEQSFGNVQALLNAIYSDIPDGMLYIGGAAMMASATDEAEFTAETNTVQSFNTGSWNAINNPDFVWGNYYRSIRKVNQFLLSTGKVNLDPWKLDPSPSAQQVYQTNLAAIKRWTYEARFLRAYYYFELVKRYGGVPLLTKALSLEDDVRNIPRASLNDCLQFITAECDSAAAQLPLNTSTFPYVAATDLGRVTRLTALALKSRVLLYAASDLFNNPGWAGGYAKPEFIALPTGDRAARWKAASDAAKVVIDAGGAVTLGNYKSLFNTFNNPEIIFTRSNAASNQFERNNSPIGFNLGLSGNTPSQDLVDAYEVKVNATTAVKFDWNDPAMRANPYANRDPRLGFSIVTNNSAFGTPSRNVQLWTGGLDARPIINASKTGYYLRKYQIESLNLINGNTGVHSWIIFRFPEMYLNYAEALNEWNPGNADIKKYVDLVRTRTGVAMPPLPTGLSQADMRERIRNEKRVEFAFEDHRFWDVRRWMQGPAYFNKPLTGVNITRNADNTFTYAVVKVEDRVFTPKMYLYPIPQSELNIVTGMIQNPLW